MLKFVLWDSYGNPDYRNVWMTFVKGNLIILQLKSGSMVNVLFFDFSSKESFQKLNDWVKLIQEHGESNSILCMIGNCREEVNK